MPRFGRLFSGWRTAGRTAVAGAAGLAEADDLLADVLREPDPDRVRALVHRSLADLSGCEHVVICDLADGGSRYQARDGSPGGRGAGFAARGRLARWLRVNGEPLLLPDDADVVEYLSEEEQEELERVGARVCLPGIARGQLVNIVLLCWRGERPSRLDERLETLQRFCHHAALAFSRAAETDAERERQQAVSRAQQLAAAGQLAAAMAHEIRNPLATIRSGVQFAADSAGDAAASRELLHGVVAEVDRINRVISQVLGFSRPRELSLDRVDLEAVVDHALMLIGPYSRHHQIEIDRSGPRAAVTVTADAGELQQVLLNVLLNACEASPDGGRVSLSIACADAPPRVRIVVADTGRGMTSAEAARAFEPYFTTKANGTGLGLAICREVMHRHGGAIDLESRPGLGTTVTLMLPRPVP